MPIREALKKKRKLLYSIFLVSDITCLISWFNHKRNKKWAGGEAEPFSAQQNCRAQTGSYGGRGPQPAVTPTSCLSTSMFQTTMPPSPAQEMSCRVCCAYERAWTLSLRKKERVSDSSGEQTKALREGSPAVKVHTRREPQVQILEIRWNCQCANKVSKPKCSFKILRLRAEVIFVHYQHLRKKADCWTGCKILLVPSLIH